MIDIARIETHYQTPTNGLRVSESRVQRLGFDTTLFFLDKHLPPRSTLLALGAERGTYALHFARKGNRVLATDGAEAHIEALVSQIEDEGLGSIQVRQADPTRLEALSDWDFQGVLCLGPYQKLRTRELRRRCLLECRRVVHERGIVAVSYLNRTFVMGLLVRDGVPLTKAQFESLVQNDDSRNDYPDPKLNEFHYTTPEAVEAEVRSCGFEIIDHAAVDGPYPYFGPALDAFDDDAYRDFFGYHVKTCTQPSQRGASRVGLVMLRKV